ncbi:hypothetical protein HR060_05535 [Catenovulum sp. SM1970]|uniref:hypothetical protein n=1 Tax=Marinifaba aquimaris TaxID=2741323 RepID=UPI00157442BB|nr:hypothetical protein [Marinifaba aquimaris]NTS76325.1 hypothetical protein [Marinifaba aquimaris]
MNIPEQITVVLVICIAAALLYVAYVAINLISASPKLKNNTIRAGFGKSRCSIDLTDIASIELAGLFDVWPSDYFWTITAKDQSQISFFGRSTRSQKFLQQLEQQLPHFSVSAAQTIVDKDSIFEESLVIWPPQLAGNIASQQ